ncbi:MAG: trypsin-like serine peptidase [Bryobacteraceae bacterium]
MYLQSRGLGIAADVRKQSTAPSGQACPHPLLVPAGVPLREHIRCLERRLAVLRRQQAETDRISCDLERAKLRLATEPAPTPPSSTPVTVTTVSPLRFVCRVHTRTEEPGQRIGHSIGTGLLIHPRIVLTSAHVVFPPQARGRTVSVEVTPGQNGDGMPFGGPFRADAWTAAPGWNATMPCEHDFALVRLPKATVAGFWPIGLVSAEDVMGVDVHHAGYPVCQADAPGKQMVRGVGQILSGVRYNRACSIKTKFQDVDRAPLDNATRTLAHNIPTCESQSGGPLWIADVCTREPVAVALHQGRLADGRFGRAVLFSPVIVKEIRTVLGALLK